MDGRARYLLTPDFTYSETNPNLPPVVGRTVRWPLFRPQNYVYPSDNTETPPVPAAFTHLCYSTQRQSDGGNPIRTTADTSGYHQKSLQPSSRHLRNNWLHPICPTVNQNRLRSSALDCPALALEQLTLLQRISVVDELINLFSLSFQ
jgi:hypothetical protein